MAVTVFRLNPDGSIDTPFAAGGFATIPQSSVQDAAGDVVALDVAFQPGGSILASGEAPGGGLAAVRLLSNGQIDPTFGASGTSIAIFDAATDRAGLVAVNSSTGQFVLVGTTGPAAATQTAVAAFNSDGSPDTAFATTGQTLLPAPMPETTNGIGPESTSAIPPAAIEFPFPSIDYSFAGYQSDGNILIGA